jgi:ATP-dependent Lon protease
MLDIAQHLPLLPLRAGVVLPEMVVTIALESDDARAAADAAVDGCVVLVPRLADRYATVGTIARIESMQDARGGRALVVRGLARARIGAGKAGPGGALLVEVEPVEPPVSDRARALAGEYRAVVSALLEHRGAGRLAGVLAGAEHPSVLADTAVYAPDLGFEERVQLLETVDVEARLELVLGWARAALAEHELTERVRRDVVDGLESAQREAILRRQLDAIRKELGEGESDEVAEYRARLDSSGAPEAVREAVAKELDRFERLGAANPEHAWIRTWLDTVLDVPWGSYAAERGDLAGARAILDADHEGLDDVKERVLEFLAVRSLRAARRDAHEHRDAGDARAEGDAAPGAPAPRRRGAAGTILLLVGPPGVGKTSLGESVARALARPFARVAVGGVRDEAEIRGHRRTYVGARPGRIVRALTEAGAMNPVLLIDEIDKVGAGAFTGDPASALLEVLDPAQNHTFRDHYLEVDLDLSDVVFLATANVVETIPPPLLDRMEVVALEGYSDDEKVVIAKRHLLPRQRAEHGLAEGELEVSDDALRVVIRRYTREAGVRSLERRIAALARKAARRVAEGATGVHVGVDDLAELLGRPKLPADPELVDPAPGVVTGLAVTGFGGDVLVVEASAMPGEAGLQVTGQLGDVMTESAQLALSFVRSHAGELGVDASALEGRRIHLHVPAGAVPKDGPSAGIAMTTALVGLLTNRATRAAVGMTGEVTLRGRVLPIGGVKHKLLAAHRGGLREVVLPKANEPDLDDVPQSVRDDLTIHLVDDVREVLDLALERS